MNSEEPNGKTNMRARQITEVEMEKGERGKRKIERGVKGGMGQGEAGRSATKIFLKVFFLSESVKRIPHSKCIDAFAGEKRL